eukprot:TRINITY_DN6736_c2_g1_i2.p1 TRINITY_DN6736_c2_g1~~TRINITY_DN6736_c2_g1_i2.p1  ORF type:complete len:107 (-),score=18.46 TRINITY_DN6736_c2_g1_i2:1633-1953(-)
MLKMKAEIEELALAETTGINLTKKAADLQVQLNQQHQDNHVSACQSCKAVHQEKMYELLPSLHGVVYLFCFFESGHYSKLIQASLLFIYFLFLIFFFHSLVIGTSK